MGSNFAETIQPNIARKQDGVGLIISHSKHPDTRQMYIALLQSAILNFIYKDPPVIKHVTQTDDSMSLAFSVGDAFNSENRTQGMEWPSVAHSMIGLKRMTHLQYCVETVLHEEIEGDLIETGVWRGGACIFMQGILKAYGATDRQVFVADSFEGLPPPDVEKYPKDKEGKYHLMTPLAISLEQVQENFRVYGLLDDNVKFLKGWFKDTLPTASVEKLSVVRLDGDMYESTMDALTSLYHKVSPGGFVIIDDYGVVAVCKAAVHDFLQERGLEETVEIIDIDGVGVYWRVPH